MRPWLSLLVFLCFSAYGGWAQAADLEKQSVADSSRRAGDLDRAIALYDEILAADPNAVDAKEGKALALIGKGDLDTPPALLAEALKADPKRWKTLNALGILFATRNLQAEAQQYFHEALKFSPGNPTVLNNLGLSQALNHQNDEAVASLKQASERMTQEGFNRKRVDLNLALAYAVAGKQDEARAVAEKYFSGPVLANNLTIYNQVAKDSEAAKAYLNIALIENKAFYEKVWSGEDSQLMPAAGEEKPKKKKKKKPATESSSRP